MQRKDAKLYGEAGHTGSWRSASPFHILQTGQVGSGLSAKWLHLVEITNSFIHRELSYKLVVVGGGAGGCGTANKFANKLGKDQVRVNGKSDGEPSETFMTFRLQ